MVWEISSELPTCFWLTLKWKQHAHHCLSWLTNTNDRDYRCKHEKNWLKDHVKYKSIEIQVANESIWTWADKTFRPMGFMGFYHHQSLVSTALESATWFMFFHSYLPWGKSSDRLHFFYIYPYYFYPHPLWPNHFSYLE